MRLSTSGLLVNVPLCVQMDCSRASWGVAGPDQTVIAAMRRKFNAAQTSLNSLRTLLMPLKLNCLNPSTCLIQVLGGSTMALRRRYFDLARESRIPC